MDIDDVLNFVYVILILSFLFWEGSGGYFSKEMTLHYTSEKCLDVENLETCGKREYLKTTFKISEERQQVFGLHQGLEKTEIQEVCLEELNNSDNCLSGKPFLLKDCIVMNRDNWTCKDFHYPGFGIVGTENGSWVSLQDGGSTIATAPDIHIKIENWKTIWWIKRTIDWLTDRKKPDSFTSPSDGQTYVRPADMTDEDWNSYKAEELLNAEKLLNFYKITNVKPEWTDVKPEDPVGEKTTEDETPPIKLLKIDGTRTTLNDGEGNISYWKNVNGKAVRDE